MIHSSPQQEVGLQCPLQAVQSTETHLLKHLTPILTLPETGLQKTHPIISNHLVKEEDETGTTDYFEKKWKYISVLKLIE